MTRLIITMLFLITCYDKVNGQHLIDSIQIIERLLRPKNDSITFVYADRIDNYFIDRFRRVLARRKIYGYNVYQHKEQHIILTKMERAYILNQLNKFTKSYWNDNLFRNSKLISVDTLWQLLHDSTGQRRLYFATHYGRRHSQFTNPIFFRNNQLFIIQFFIMYSSDCGQDALAIYKKQNNNWIRWLWIKGGYY